MATRIHSGVIHEFEFDFCRVSEFEFELIFCKDSEFEFSFFLRSTNLNLKIKNKVNGPKVTCKYLP